MPATEPLAAPTKTIIRAPKALRRRELIEATIDSLARRGYDETTMAVVADGAGLSRGIVNFHFETKEKLLVETLRYLRDDYREHWRKALEKAGPGADERLFAFIAADFDRKICTPKKLAAWCAFWGEAKSRSSYRDLCSANDDEYQAVMLDLCRTLAAPGQDPELLARGLTALTQGLWLNLVVAPSDLSREAARHCALSYLGVIFPHTFPPERLAALGLGGEEAAR